MNLAYNKFYWITIFVVVPLFCFSCQRSSAFKRDQNYFQNEPESYYNKTKTKNSGGAASVSPAQRIEAMGQPKKRVAVLNFWNDTPVRATDLGPFAADEIKRLLSLTSRMLVPSENQTEFSTQDVVEGTQVKVAQLMREGRRMGVSVLVIGRISKIVFRSRGDEVGLFKQKQSLVGVDVELKVFDVAAGREILTIAKSGEASSNAIVTGDSSGLDSPEFRSELTKLGLRDALALVSVDVTRAVEKMAWQGHVAKVAGSKVYVNAGRASGLVAGDVLRVLSQGEDVFDPATGSFLGRSEGHVKGTVEVVDFIGTDGAITQVHTGGNFQSGDAVRLY